MQVVRIMIKLLRDISKESEQILRKDVKKKRSILTYQIIYYGTVI